MSVWAVSWALGVQVPDAVSRSVLVALGHLASDRDEVRVPAQVLRDVAVCSTARVGQALRELEDCGLVQLLAASSQWFALRLLIPDVFTGIADALPVEVPKVAL